MLESYNHTRLIVNWRYIHQFEPSVSMGSLF
jgi:hypothetical protein